MKYDSKKYALSSYFDSLLFRTIKKYLQLQKDDKVLEVGCNRGRLVEKMRDAEAQAQGVDVNPEAIRHGVSENIQVMDATDLQFPKESFHKIYSVHTIEHILNAKKALQEMERVLKPGGKIVLIYPAEPGFLRGLFALKSAILVYKNPFLAREIHIHNLNPKKIQELIRGTQLKHIESHFPIVWYPQYLTVLEKKNAGVRVKLLTRTGSE
ncbi:class I SAM-dependent methyltransferase [Patescibacteria group bacterium]|nr:class I SAM-dependent methyltransferase [Patescibacteria group bacterium]